MSCRQTRRMLAPGLLVALVAFAQSVIAEDLPWHVPDDAQVQPLPDDDQPRGVPVPPRDQQPRPDADAQRVDEPIADEPIADEPVDDEAEVDVAPDAMTPTVVPQPITKQPITPARTYFVSAVSIQVQSPALPRIANEQISVALAPAPNGGYVPRPAGEAGALTITLAHLAAPMSKADGLHLQGSGIRAISQAIVSAYNTAGYGGVLVNLGPDQIDGTGTDIRPEGNTALTFTVRALTVTTLRTQASGDRIDTDATNHPAHQRILDDSPIAAGDLLRTQQVEHYTKFLSRHPGRRVDAAVVPGDEPDTLALDYLVQENKPWIVYGTVSNTGTEQTAEWRQQFGFTHYQLTGNNDILSIVYSTAGFEDTHSISGSYELPLFHPRLRGRAFASYSEFLASDVGFAGANFSGESWSAGGELIFNFFQQGDWFIDLLAGAQYQHIEVDNEIFVPTLEGREQFIRPRVGLQTQQVTETHSLFGSVLVDWNADDLAGTDAPDASRLGRANVDAQWTILMFSASASAYLEPLLDRDAWEDLSTPGSSTLAHEVVINFRGQHVFDNQRAIPQAQMTAGGFYTVRGYDESTAVGDNALILTGEYRFHLPRIFAPRPEPTQIFGQDFRVAPSGPRGRPDWDLILKAFVDYAHVSNNNAAVGEQANDLLGTGVGVELQLMRFLTLRVEWGIALEEAAQVNVGDNRFHIAATLVH